MVLNKPEDQLSQLKQTGVVNYKTLPFCSSSQGVYINFVRGLCVFFCGNKVWGGQIQKKVNNKHISKLLMYDFKKKSHLLYDYEHQNLILSVLVSEAFKLAMSGGLDKTLVLHDLESGKTIKRFDTKYGYVQCLFNLGTAVAVGDIHTVRFLDLQTKEMDEIKVKAGGEFINCMNLSTRGNDQNNNMALLVGGSKSNKIDKINIPEAIAKLGKYILEMQNRPINTENFKQKMILLENENKRLREENQRLKQKMFQEQNERIHVIAKFVNKNMYFLNEIKRQKAINSQLEKNINQLKNELTTLKFKKKQSEAVRRNLLLYQALSKNRKMKAKSEASGCDPDKSLSEENPGTQRRVEELKKRIEQRQAQIENLHREIDNFHDQEDEHQTLRKEFDRLDRYLKRMIKNNGKVKKNW